MKYSEKYIKNIIREMIEDFVDEANYPSSFNMDEFKGLRSFSARLNYCKQHLQPIKAGSGRYVFTIDNDTVLKLAKNQKGVAQNEQEYSYSSDGYNTGTIATVFDSDENFLWIEMEKLSKCTPKKFFQSTGINFENFVEALLYEDYRVRGGRWKRPEPENMQELYEIEFFTDLVDTMISYDMPVGDLTRLSTYGITTDGQVKIVDAGLSQDVYDSYYK